MLWVLAELIQASALARYRLLSTERAGRDIAEVLFVKSGSEESEGRAVTRWYPREVTAITRKAEESDPESIATVNVTNNGLFVRR